MLHVTFALLVSRQKYQRIHSSHLRRFSLFAFGYLLLTFSLLFILFFLGFVFFVFSFFSSHFSFIYFVVRQQPARDMKPSLRLLTHTGEVYTATTTCPSLLPLMFIACNIELVRLPCASTAALHSQQQLRLKNGKCSLRFFFVLEWSVSTSKKANPPTLKPA